jgi:predicted small secreted protein
MHLSVLAKKRHISYLPSQTNKENKYINKHFMHFKKAFGSFIYISKQSYEKQKEIFSN